MLRETTASWEGNTSASALYAIEYLPTFVLLAPDGQVIFSPYEKHGFVDDERQQLQAKLAEIFEEWNKPCSEVLQRHVISLPITR